jgi:hypothetical protein
MSPLTSYLHGAADLECGIRAASIRCDRGADGAGRFKDRKTPAGVGGNKGHQADF